MTKRRMYLFLCASSLFLGALLYIIFRENSYIGIAANHFAVISASRKIFAFLSCNFVKFYLPDFLWCFSLCCGLFAIYLPTNRIAFICTFSAVSLGCIWELLQYVDFVSGTGDICDVLMYLLSGIVCTVINLLRSGNHEEN